MLRSNRFCRQSWSNPTCFLFCVINSDAPRLGNAIAPSNSFPFFHACTLIVVRGKVIYIFSLGRRRSNNLRLVFLRQRTTKKIWRRIYKCLNEMNTMYLTWIIVVNLFLNVSILQWLSTNEPKIINEVNKKLPELNN